MLSRTYYFYVDPCIRRCSPGCDVREATPHIIFHPNPQPHIVIGRKVIGCTTAPAAFLGKLAITAGLVLQYMQIALFAIS